MSQEDEQRKFAQNRAGGGGRWSSAVMASGEVKELRRRVAEGNLLSFSDAMKLIASHEHLRAHALVNQHKMNMLSQENDDLQLLVRRLEKKS